MADNKKSIKIIKMILIMFRTNTNLAILKKNHAKKKWSHTETLPDKMGAKRSKILRIRRIPGE
jgi:hypothetical protein